MGGIPGIVTHPLDTARRAASTALDAAESVGLMALGLVPDDIALGARLPPYPVIPPAQRAQALARSRGLTVPQPVIRSSNGKLHEPVSLYVAGTRQELYETLGSQGWKKAHELNVKTTIATIGSIFDRLTGGLFRFNYKQSPVSDKYLDGDRHEAAFNKNNQHDLARDHLRIWDTGREDATGRPIWAIAATRDTALHIKPKDLGGYHETDKAIDGERDLVMTDLLASSRVATWKIAEGVPAEADRRHLQSRYRTDGHVYVVELTGRSAPR